ncbi:MAG TPA: hypothetical protein VGH99_08545 [Pseudonocardia sp.]|jgi:hypothetical protein
MLKVVGIALLVVLGLALMNALAKLVLGLVLIGVLVVICRNAHHALTGPPTPPTPAG